MSLQCPIFGDQSYLFLADEVTYGVVPGSPSYNFIPVDSYALKLVPEQRVPMPFTGLTEEMDKMIIRSSTSGQITFPLQGWHLTPLTTSIAQYLMAWGFADLEVVCNLASKLAEWAEGPNVENKQSTGLVVNGATLTGSEDNGGKISLALDLRGVAENPLVTAQVVPAGFVRANEMIFQDCSFKIGPNSGALVAVPWKGFTWQQQRSLTPAFNGLAAPQFYRPGKPVNNFSFNIEKADGTWDAIRRSTTKNEYYGRLTLKAPHNGTGTVATNYAQCVINFPKLSFVETQDNYVRSGPLQQTIQFAIQKPQSLASSTQTWSDVA